MSLRTKILATVVGLNLLVLLLGVSVLLFVLPPSPGVPSELVSLLSRVAADPRSRGEGVDARLRAARALRAHGPGVLEVILLREQGDDVRTPVLVDDRGIAPRPPDEEIARAVELHRKARKEGEAQVTDAEIAMVLEGPVFTDDPGEVPKGRFEGVYVRWSAARADLSRVRSLYFTLLAGIVVVTAAAWVLISRLVVRPFAALAAAADRAAAGDLSARVPASGAGDEFDRTAEAFNRMAAEVSEHHEQLQDRVLQAIDRSRKAERHLVIAQRLAATGKLAAGIAHEINNPLGGMRNAVRSLARGDLDAGKTAEYLDLVQDGLARIEDTVKKVLLFTPRTAQPRATDLVDVARKAVALARHRLERNGVRIEERYADAGPVRLFGDPNELQQVALNLVINAGDAISEKGGDDGPRPAGGGVVRVGVATEGDAAILEVSDDGVGMTHEVLAQCFDFFFTTKPPGEGTGLGLAVVHNIVTNHGGRIDVSSEVGKGTTFRVVLPLESPSPDEPPAAEGTAPP
jgi:signal transduction histidine kinase